MSLLGPIRDQLQATGRAVFQVKVSPKSSRTEVAGALPDGTLRIRVAAPPERGKANKELCKFLARQLGLPKSAVEVQSGHASTTKTITASRA